MHFLHLCAFKFRINVHKNPHSNYHGEATLSIREISNDYWLAIDQE